MSASPPDAYGVAPPGYRLPAATRLGRVRLQIADLARSLAYYESVIGLRVVGRRDGVATLSPAGEDRVLLEVHEHPGARPVAPRGQIGMYHFAILLPDRAALGSFVRHLAELGVRAGMSDHFVSEAIYLRDPDGLEIEVYADRPREQWRTDGGQLYMTSAPLDVPSLATAANGASWSGAPQGTTIGHMHLYVRDLAAAAAFYHDALGFDKVVWSYPGALFLSAGGYHHHLGTNTWAASAPAASSDDAHMLGWELVLPTPRDVEDAARSLEDHGFAAERAGGIAQTRDPWGTRLDLVSAPL